ncbi:hypothetical protein PYW07_003638 [Mythimna separata]|uniref:Uncharacterized protein n=1 Tax=Mythimna separata TaxID=271217 RepID=A0AAD8DTG5_MYTSE|nr:hypothetical protein PYW07_003638 [Mythimna separata]
MEPQNCSDSDEEVANNSGRIQDVVSQEFVIHTPTEDHEMVLDSLVQEADVLPIVNEPSAVENVTPTEQNLQNKKGKRKRRQEGNWKKNVAKRLRNSSKSYQSVKTKKNIPERILKSPCKENCAFKCQSNITDEQRQLLLKEFWNLGDIGKQWSFIANSVEAIILKHRYVRIDSDGNVAPIRDNNNAFFYRFWNKDKSVQTFFQKHFGDY